MQDPASACHRPRCSSSTERRRAREQEALRVFWCEGCGRRALVCRWCDCGQRYCGQTCAQQARRASWRRSSARHQRTPEGRANQRARQRTYRRRQKEKVTQQTPARTRGLGQPGPVVPRPAQEKADENFAHPPSPVPEHPCSQAGPRSKQAQSRPLWCDRCGRRSSFWLRREFLVQLRRRRMQR